MDVHEYQAKNLLATCGLPIQKGCVVEHVDAIKKICADLTAPFVVKAQIHAGGRGKGGGIRFAHTQEEVQEAAGKLLGSSLVTPQTGPEGKIVHSVYVVEAADFEKEFYVSFFLNRKQACVTLMVSRQGGGEIEDIAKKTPEAILSIDIDPLYGLKSFHKTQVTDFFKWPKALQGELTDLLEKTYQLFVDKDMSLLEINPLVLTKEGQMLVIDTKITFDDNALFRQKDMACLKDPREEAPQETEALRFGLSYVQLKGNIGCMVNGAGLAMATMDAVDLFGGKPANFLDVGGSASLEQIKAALRIILSDTGVAAVLVNIFGGIMHCDLIAKALDEAVKVLGIVKPIVVRLAGTHVDKAEAFLKESAIQIDSARSLEEGAKRVVSLAGEA